MKKLVKRMLPRKIKVEIASYLKQENVFLPNNNRAFVFLAADYGNIGDLAITAAQKAFLRKYLANYDVVYIPISKTRIQLRSIKSQVNSNDLVTIIGGGNMGSLYPDIEELRQLVICSFPKNRIVCFPQTLDWDNSITGIKSIKHIQKVYGAHNDLHIFARESITRNKLQEIFSLYKNVKVGYTPDIVLSTTGKTLGCSEIKDFSGILKCLRDDKERLLDFTNAKILDKALADCGEPVTITDTHAGGDRLETEICDELLATKINQFQSSKLIITDRLHGMILSILAGTPCLVIPNSNHKIHQTWLDWLETHRLVKFLEIKEFTKLPEVIAELLNTPHGDIYSSPLCSDAYLSLKEALVYK